eukprot:15678119-Heterocapsa_arctica.AAC.1
MAFVRSHRDTLRGLALLRGLRVLRPAEHGAQVVPAHEEDGEGREQHVGGVQLQGQQGIRDVLVERPRGDDRSGGASGAHNSGGDRQVLREHVRDNAIGGALGHVHKDREYGKHDDGRNPAHVRGHGAEAEEEGGLGQEREEVHPEAALHLPADVCPIRGNAAHGAREEVHCAEHHRQGPGGLEPDAEVVVEVRGQEVVHHKLTAEAGAVLE